MEKTQHTHKARYPLRRNKREFSWVFRNSKYPINNKVIHSSFTAFKFETYNTTMGCFIYNGFYTVRKYSYIVSRNISNCTLQ